jgi:hypothetical protein
LAEAIERRATVSLIGHGSHQGYDGSNVSLVHFHTVAEAFDDYDRTLLSGRGPMHVEQDFRFGELWWHSVSRLHVVDCAAAVTDQFSLGVVNGNDNPLVHQPRPVVEATTECARCLFFEPAISQVRMCLHVN